MGRIRRRSSQPSHHSHAIVLIILVLINSYLNDAVKSVAATVVVSSPQQQEEKDVVNDNRAHDVDPALVAALVAAPSSDRNEDHGNIDQLDDGIFDAVSPDPDCRIDGENNANGNEECYHPPASTLDEEEDVIVSTSSSSSLVCSNEEVTGAVNDSSGSSSATTTRSTAAAGAADVANQVDKSNNQQQLPQQPVCHQVDEPPKKTTIKTDKHWGSDPTILQMRDKLRGTTTSATSNSTLHPPIFLLPGLASTRLVAWRYKSCPASLSPLLPVVHDIKVQDVVWLNLQLLLRTPMDMDCMKRCLQLGPLHQDDVFCKLRPDEGLDAISSLAPGGLGSHLLVGGTNTVYAWLIQWLADHLGYDVTTLIGLPYDWRLSPHKMQQRDGFLTWMRRHIETAVQVRQGQPGIMVAHSMGNLIFRYFLEWLRQELRQEAHQQIVLQRARNDQKRKRQKKRIQVRKRTQNAQQDGEQPQRLGSVHLGVVDGEEVGDDDRVHQEEDEDKMPVHHDGNHSSNVWSGGWMTSTASSAVADADASAAGQQEPLPWSRKAGSSLTDESTATAENSINDNPVPPAAGGGRQRKHRHRDKEELLELAEIQGDEKWYQWIEQHIWTYVGLSAPMLGAVNPLRAVISGENMGLPISDEVARVMELTFGSTNTVIPLSSKMGFCDDWTANQWDEEPAKRKKSSLTSDDDVAPSPFSNSNTVDPKLACLDDIMTDIELHETPRHDPWRDFPALKALLKDRADWDSDFPMIEIEHCSSTANRNGNNSESNDRECLTRLGAQDAQSGNMFAEFSRIWKEKNEPLIIKREQLLDSFQRNTKVPNILNSTWERPLIKHVIMAYGVDIPTEVGYVYKKKAKDASSSKSKYDGVPSVQKVIWEEPFGRLTEERVERERGGGLTEVLIRKKSKRLPLNGGDGKGISQHSGDGTIPYLSLSWAHTWLLHATRAMRYGSYDSGNQRNPLDNISVSHRPKGAMEWKSGPPPFNNRTDPKILKMEPDSDTGTLHPHGTKYKPEMVRYHTVGKSRTTGIEYSTTVIEAIGVEHKETTRNYDVLAACFTDVLKYMHNDFGLV